MPIYRVEGTLKSNNQSTVIFVQANEPVEVRNSVIRHGLRAQRIDEVVARAVPFGTEILKVNQTSESATSRYDLGRIAMSPLIQHPVRTIAFGTLLGMVMFFFVLLMLTAVFGSQITIG